MMREHRITLAGELAFKVGTMGLRDAGYRHHFFALFFVFFPAKFGAFHGTILHRTTPRAKGQLYGTGRTLVTRKTIVFVNREGTDSKLSLNFNPLVGSEMRAGDIVLYFLHGHTHQRICDSFFHGIFFRTFAYIVPVKSLHGAHRTKVFRRLVKFSRLEIGLSSTIQCIVLNIDKVCVVIWIVFEKADVVDCRRGIVNAACVCAGAKMTIRTHKIQETEMSGKASKRPALALLLICLIFKFQPTSPKLTLDSINGTRGLRDGFQETATTSQFLHFTQPIHPYRRPVSNERRQVCSCSAVGIQCRPTLQSVQARRKLGGFPLGGTSNASRILPALVTVLQSTRTSPGPRILSLLLVLLVVVFGRHGCSCNEKLEPEAASSKPSV